MTTVTRIGEDGSGSWLLTQPLSSFVAGMAYPRYDRELIHVPNGGPAHFARRKFVSGDFGFVGKSMARMAHSIDAMVRDWLARFVTLPNVHAESVYKHRN